MLLVTFIGIVVGIVFLPGSDLGKAMSGKATRKAMAAVRIKPVHHAPIQRGLSEVIPNLRETEKMKHNILRLCYILSDFLTYVSYSNLLSCGISYNVYYIMPNV